MLTPHDEYAYDLLPWALNEYNSRLITTTTKDANKTPQDFIQITDFIESLSNHFRATPPLVRYGASICLHEAISIYPQLIQDNRHLYAFVVSGCLDTDYLTRGLYISMLESVKDDSKQDPETLFNANIRKMVVSFQNKDIELDHDSIFAHGSVNYDSKISISQILEEAVKSSPPLAAKILQRMVNSLDYLPKSIKLAQLELVRVWASRNEKYDTMLVQSLTPLFSGDEQIQLKTLDVLNVLMPKFKVAPQADVLFCWNSFSSLIDAKSSVAVLLKVLSLVRIFPVEKLGNPAASLVPSINQVYKSIIRFLFS